MEDIQASKQKQKDILDLIKYVLCIFIVAIHTCLFGDYIYPWVRIAVPLFFIISAYLLTEKLKETPKENHWAVTWKYIKRNLILYLFWFVVLLPFTIIARRNWWEGNVGLFIWKIISNSLFSSTFKGSWFIVGCIYGGLMIYLSMKLPKVFSVIIGVLLFAFTLVLTSYSFLLENNESFAAFKYWYVFIFTTPEFSFPVAIGNMLFGSFISRTNIALRNKWHYIIIVVLLLLSFVALYFEWRYLSYGLGTANFEVGTLLLVTCPLLFITIKDINVSIKHALMLRRLSILIYLIHIAIADSIRFLFSLINVDPNSLGITVVTFFITLIISHGLAFFLLFIEKKKHFSWVRYSH